MKIDLDRVRACTQALVDLSPPRVWCDTDTTDWWTPRELADVCQTTDESCEPTLSSRSEDVSLRDRVDTPSGFRQVQIHRIDQWRARDSNTSTPSTSQNTPPIEQLASVPDPPHMDGLSVALWNDQLDECHLECSFQDVSIRLVWTSERRNKRRTLIWVDPASSERVTSFHEASFKNHDTDLNQNRWVDPWRTTPSDHYLDVTWWPKVGYLQVRTCPRGHTTPQTVPQPDSLWFQGSYADPNHEPSWDDLSDVFWGLHDHESGWAWWSRHRSDLTDTERRQYLQWILRDF